MTDCWYQFRDWATFHVELGIGDTNLPTTTGLWGTSKWNASTAFWSGQEPSWLDVTDRVAEVNVDRGRVRWIDRIGMSGAVVKVDNADGWITWDSHTLGLIDAAPGVPLRIWAQTPDGARHDVWRGFVEGITDSYQPWQRPQASLVCQDALAQIAHVDLPEQAPTGAGERSDVRIGRILNACDWPAQWRKLDTGQVTMQATNFARNMADELGITSDSEGGVTYAGTDGNVYLRNRDWLRLASYATTVQAIIGPGGAVCGSEHHVVRDGADVRNDVQIARAGSTMQRFTDQNSIARYRRRAFSRGDLICETDAQAALIAQRILSSRANATVRLTDVTIPIVDQASATFATSVDYGWRLQVNWAQGDESWSRTVHVMGIRHQIRPDGWELQLAVDDAIASPTEPWGIGKWGTAKWTEAA